MSLTTTGLVDSGSSHCFIDSTYACDHNIPLISIPRVTLHFLNGSFGEDIIQVATLPIRFSTNNVIELLFYITPLDCIHNNHIASGRLDVGGWGVLKFLGMVASVELHWLKMLMRI